MKTRALRLLGLLLTVALVATCTDQTPTAAPGDEGVEALTPTLGAVLACDLTSGQGSIARDVRSFFLMPERQTAADLARDLGTACGTDNSVTTTNIALQLIGMMETAIQNGRVGSASAGASLTRSLLACTTAAGCSSQAFAPYAIPAAAALTQAIGEASGIFALRAGGTAAVVARSAIAFTDDLGRANAALFGTQVSGPSWANANQSAFVFFYGYRTDPTFVGEEVVANNVGYSFNRWPDMGTFLQDDLVQVGACFAQGVGFPHAPGEPEPKPRMQREGTLLSEFSALSFCPPAPQSASLLAPVKAFALSVLPRSWSAMFLGDTRTPVIGGSAYDFSNFAPAGADAAGALVLVDSPKARYEVNEPLMIRIRAESGGGTPMERVPVELYVAGNSGTPAGAVVVDLDPSANDGTWGYTIENGGTFLFDQAGLGKPGGYQLCARVRTPPGFAGFTFTEVCTGLFHVN